MLCLALASAPAAPGAADEGFFAGNKPAAVRAIWPSVFALVCKSRKGVYTATAFLVGKSPSRRRKKRSDYVFMTAGHAIGECKRTRRHLAENINQRQFEEDGITVARPPRRLKGVKTVRVDDAYDLALIKVEAPAKLRIGKPVEVDGKCDPSLGQVLYAVGFPGVDERRSLHLRREEKRWSKGEIVGLGKADFRGRNEIYIATTIDSLPGSSGGPVVDEAGRLIGVVAKGAASDENGFRYDVDPKEPRDWQTFLAPCTAVLRLLQKSGVE
jgi:S1-C subfamily serine protease